MATGIQRETCDMRPDNEAWGKITQEKERDVHAIHIHTEGLDNG